MKEWWDWEEEGPGSIWRDREEGVGEGTVRGESRRRKRP